MFRLSRRSIRSHPGRFLLTVVAVTLGVGFVVGSLVVTDTVRSAVSGLFADIAGTVDVSVRAASKLDTGAQGGPPSRGRIDASLVDVVDGVDGVASAHRTVSGYAQLLDLDGEAVTTTGAPLLGVSWDEAADSTAVTLDDGRGPRGPDEVAIDRDTAEDYGFAVGDRTTVLLVGGRREVTIVGIFTFGETNSLLGARLTAFEFGAAQEAFDAVGQAETIDVTAEDGVDRDDLARRLQEVLPDGVEAVTIDQVNDEGTESVEGFITIFQNVLLGFAGVALLVSAFFINNTFAILLGQRTRELALLRAVGASRRQIVGSVVIEALFIGLTSSVAGVAVGLALAVAIQGLLSAGGFVLPEHPLELSPTAVVAALAVGVVVTLLSALFPARRAADLPPVAALGDGSVPDHFSSRRRGVVGGLVTGTGVVSIAIALFALSGAGLFSLLAVGAVATFVGVAMLSPLLAGPVGAAIGRPFAARSVAGRLARGNVARSPQRTARAASALMVGLTLVSTVFVVGTSLKESFSASITGRVRADFVVFTPTFTGFSPTVAAAVAEIPEIDSVSGVRGDVAIVDGRSESIVAVDPIPAARLIDIGVTSGRVEDLGPGGIAIHADEARDRGLAVGDSIRVEFASGGPRDLEVRAVYDDATYAGNFLVDLESFVAAYPTNSLDLFLFARTAPDADAADARRQVEAVLAPFPQIEVQDRTEFEQTQRDQLDQILVAVNGLLGLALFIALMGISNTLALSVIERTREIGLLRAVGMERRAVKRMIRIESTIVAVFGALLGVGLGLVLGIAVSVALPDSAVTQVAIPWATLSVVIVVAALFGVLAGSMPARRAARLDVLDAISRR